MELVLMRGYVSELLTLVFVRKQLAMPPVLRQENV
jgi:hypothetical protein